MKNIFISFLLVGFGAFAQNSYTETVVRINPNSELNILGSSNVNSFQCVFNAAVLTNPKQVAFVQKEDQVFFKEAVLKLQNTGFDCGNKGITRDFHELLNTRQYPQILMELLELKKFDSQTAHASVKITIAGKSNTYTLPIRMKNNQNNSDFTGKLKLDITDFGLEAPKKALGLIVVREEIEIDFCLILEI